MLLLLRTIPANGFRREREEEKEGRRRERWGFNIPEEEMMIGAPFSLFPKASTFHARRLLSSVHTSK